MELIEKIRTIVSRLEGIANQNNPDINSLREQIDDIENIELLKLDEEFDEWRGCIYDQREPNEKEEKQMDNIGDLFIQADELIDSIREKFGIHEFYDEDEFEDQVDDEKGDDEEYNIVLNEISKSALNTIGLNNEDERNVNLMSMILIGIFSGETDDEIAGRAFAQIVLSGFMLQIDKIKDMCKETREKCKKQLFGLQIAYSSLHEYNCTAEEALAQIHMFL